MTAHTLAFLALGATAGGFINGLSGTGTALFALGFYLLVLDPITAVAIVTLMSILVGIQGAWIVRHEIAQRPARLLNFAIPGLIGVPLGLSLLNIVSSDQLRIGIAVFLIIYGAYFSFRAVLPSFSKATPVWDALVGFISGILGGAAGLSGALPVMWLSLRPWPKAQTRAVLQPFNIAILSTTVCLLWLKGAYTPTALTALFITVPIGAVAAQIGITVFRRLSDTGFRRLLIWLTLVLGLGTLISAVM